MIFYQDADCTLTVNNAQSKMRTIITKKNATRDMSKPKSLFPWSCCMFFDSLGWYMNFKRELVLLRVLHVYLTRSD